MFFEKIIIKRRLASPDAAVRLRAIAALNMDNDRSILLQMASADGDAQVRSAAITRCCDPDFLIKLQQRERDPRVLEILADRIDELYAEMALRDCAEERESDAFNRINSHKRLISVALRSNSPSLIMAAGARLSAYPEQWQTLVAQLVDDNLALELYERNAPEPESVIANMLQTSARSQLLRQAIAEERARCHAVRQAYAEEQALVEAIEASVNEVDEAAFEMLCERWRQLPEHHESLKKRVMAARYRFFRAQEELMASREADVRDHALAEDLLRQLREFAGSGNFRAVRQIVENWKRCNLSNSRGAAEFKNEFEAIALKVRTQEESLLQKYSEIQAVAEGVLGKFQAFLKAPQVPDLEVRRQLLNELEKATAELPEMSLTLSNICEAVSACERELRRRARQEAQERDLARWEHYTLKMDICSELEKFSQAPDHELLEVARKFRDLRERWNAIGAVPNEKFEELRNRYHSACTALHTRLEQFFTERDQRQQQSREVKEKLLAEAEALASSDDWNQTSNRLKELQAIWKNAGSAGGTVDRELFNRFRSACDAFFVRRNAAWDEQKKQYMLAAKRKRELCNAAEALRDKPFAFAKGEIAKLREEWRNIPSAGKDDRLLYMEFNRTLESIFTAHREAGDEARRKSEIICTELGEILQKAESRQLPIRDIEALLQENQQRWEALDFRVAADVVRRRDKTAEKLQELLCSLHHDEAMHKLESAEQLEAVIDSGMDESTLLDHLGRRLKVCGELEERLRECRVISGGGDLAGELEKAFAGNFGGEAYKLTVAELDEFLQRFVAVGQVPPDARSAVFEQFRTLYNRALDFLQYEEKNTDSVQGI